jgi:hypothetical protein
MVREHAWTSPIARTNYSPVPVRHQAQLIDRDPYGDVPVHPVETGSGADHLLDIGKPQVGLRIGDPTLSEPPSFRGGMTEIQPRVSSKADGIARIDGDGGRPSIFESETPIDSPGRPVSARVSSGSASSAKSSDTGTAVAPAGMKGQLRSDIGSGSDTRQAFDTGRPIWATQGTAVPEIRGAAPTPQTQIPTAEAVFSTIAREVVSARARDRHNVRLEVRTEDGDLVRVRMSVTSNTVTAKVSVSSAEMKELLASRVWELSQKLEAEGLVAEDIEFSLLGESDQHTRRHEFKRGRRHLMPPDISDEPDDPTLVGAVANTFDRWA